VSFYFYSFAYTNLFIICWQSTIHAKEESENWDEQDAFKRTRSKSSASALMEHFDM
jgi:hypothetical protein